MSQVFTGYDIIGDIHGCYDQLVALLELLGYKKQRGVHRHPSRQAIFLGDLVDRGPKIRETLHLVRQMVDYGSAQMVLGNHEINLVGYHTPAPSASGQSYIRERNARHTRQLRETHEQFRAYPQELHEFMQWFLTLPLFLEFEHFRVVHACWDQALIDQFLARYKTPVLGEEVLRLTADTDQLAFKLVNRLTRGPSKRLPNDEVMAGSDGFDRRYFRARFWGSAVDTYGDLVFQPDGLPRHLHRRKLTAEEKARLPCYGASEKNLFIGHYWCSGQPQPLTANVACLDYSAVQGGKLVAYRIDGPGRLSADRMVSVNARHAYGLT